MSQKSAASAISLPKGGGAIKGIGETFQPNLFTGTGNFSIPIATSPGRSGFGPQLTLQYSTGNGNSPFGLGWQLSIPRITRKTEKGLPKYDDSDIFVMSGAEDLVPCLKEIDDPDNPGKKKWVPENPIPRGEYTVARYRPRTEGLFARVEKWVRNDDGDVHWRATTKDNVTSIYGRTKEARIFDPDNENHIYEWLLQETFDAKGNHILYEYARDDPNLKLVGSIYEEHRTYCQLYIRRIYYGNLPDPLVDHDGNPILYANGSLIGYQREGSDHSDHLSLKKRRYAFEVVFDYGDWDHSPYKPIFERTIAERILIGQYRDPLPIGQQELFGADPSDSPEDNVVPIRADPFSNFRSRFEVRTLRRCRRVLMFHHFKELGGPTLVRSTDFEYDENPDTQVSFLARVAVTGYRKEGTEYIRTNMPPVTFKYSEFTPHEQRYQSITARGNDMPPLALNNPDYALVDLFGNGLPDVLHTAPTGFRYWENLGNGTLDRPQSMPQVPAGVTLSQPGVSFADMAGDGRADLLVLSEPLKGFYETTPDGTWKTFKRFDTFPSFDLSDPNVRLVDLTGDGLTDVLMTRDHHFLWFECLGEEGYAKPQFVERIRKLDEFPDIYFNDPSGRVRLADMTGDGLNDIVLIHNGRVDYWCNLGFGFFGERITMAKSPKLEYNFDPARLFLVDLDGSGCADLVYVDFGQTHFWFNRSGNSWSDEQTIPGTPAVTNSTAIQFADFFSTGTTAAVWSYGYNEQPGGNYKVLDFCGGVKPYLLTEMRNNMGATTRVRYGSSTQHCLRDEANGEPWITNLPFPVQVVDKVEVIDHISKTKLVTTYKYHHGYFDGHEREFWGFGRVDQFDSESFENFIQADLHDDDNLFENKTRAYHVPPVETRTWFHTGIYFDQDSLFAGDGPFDYHKLTNRYRREFYDGDEQAFKLADHEVDAGDTPHEAYRALRGAVLRTEIYAKDDTREADHPYLVTHNRHWVKQLQPRDGNNHAVYLAMRKESLTYHYERNPDDPRIGHDITLAIDDFGNVTDSVSIGYPRRTVPSELSEQGKLKIVYTRSNFINKVDDSKFYYVGIPCQTRRYEVTGITWPQTDLPQPLQTMNFATITGDPGDYLLFEQEHDESSTPVKRLIEWTRNYFRQDQAAGDLDSADTRTHRLALCEIESLALPYESYQAIFTDQLVKDIYGEYLSGDPRVTENMLNMAGYQREPDVDGFWWVPSGRQSFKSNGFCLPDKTRDPFGNASSVIYDSYCLLIERAVDPLENEVQACNDYRVLQPDQLTDSNGNYSMVAFDTLGLVVGTSVQSRGKLHGDSFDQFEPDLSEGQIVGYFTQPHDHGAALLGTATTRIIYDLWAYQRAVSQGIETIMPPVAATLAREIHVTDLGDGESSPIRHSFLYSDGFGREVQTKVQAEPGEVNGNPVDHRWVGTGAKIYNNKGKKPVRQFEPFFSDTHQFGIEQHGVSSIIFYDPLERVVCTLHPNHTYEKVIFDPWQQATWDVNDTASLEDPKTDGDIGTYFALLDPADYLPTWYTQRKDSDLGAAEKDAALKTKAHADTPTLAHLDVLGRVFLTVADNGTHGTYETRVKLDIQGNDRIITDPRGIEAFQHDVDMLGHKLGINSVDAGHRWALLAVDEQPVQTWDANGNRVEIIYDGLRRSIETWVYRHNADPPGSKSLDQAIIYGERLATTGNPMAPLTGNHRGRVYATLDGAGVVFNLTYDFKGNLRESVRRLAKEYRKDLDWKGISINKPVSEIEGKLDDFLEQEVFYTTSRFDALNRVTESTAPDHTATPPGVSFPKDGSIYRFTYNEANLLDKVEVDLRSDLLTDSTDRTFTTFVKNIDYNTRGQRERIEYGNGVETKYTYDPQTFRLQTIVSKEDGKLLQDLRYSYDPVGNITQVHDGAFETVFNQNEKVDPSSHYEYDPVYRLIEAKGREHQAMTACHYRQGNKKQTEFILLDLTQPINNGQALRNYIERYTYDGSGNPLQIRHIAGTNGGWTRVQKYQVDDPSLPTDLQQPVSNRLYTSDAGCPGEDTFTYTHDANGNITKMPHLQELVWDHADQLRQVTMNTVTSGINDQAYYVYNVSGQRMRKVIERGGKRREEHIYLGGFEIYRKYNGTGPTLERQTLHVMDDQRRIALVEIRTAGAEAGHPVRRFRYQMDNHLGSSLLEVDEKTQEISYEEYYPYGGTSYSAGKNETEVKRKRYRYSGKERDDETGLYYYRSRYYSPWMGRWLSCDPAGIVNELNLYAYVYENPLRFIDPAGKESLDVMNRDRPRVDQVSSGGIEPVHKEIPGGSELEAFDLASAYQNIYFPFGEYGTFGEAATIWTRAARDRELNLASGSVRFRQTFGEKITHQLKALGYSFLGLGACAIYSIERPAVWALNKLAVGVDLIGEENLTALSVAPPLYEFALLGVAAKSTFGYYTLQLSYSASRVASYGGLLSTAGSFKEAVGLYKGIREMEMTGLWRLSRYQLKLASNQGIDALFVGIGDMRGFHAALESKFAGNLGRLEVYSKALGGVRQGSNYYVGSRLATYAETGGKYSWLAEELQLKMRLGTMKSYANISDDLYELNFSMNVNFRNFQEAARKVSK
jgi:RHS repeat-associated protein